MKLEVGMYVRIQWGNGEQTISKCTNKVDMGDTQYSKNDFYIHTDKRGEVIYKSMILKASHNIIDLIEVGDRIKYELSDIKGWFYIETSKDLELVKTDFKETDIKSIVTKEQFSQMEYKI